MKTVARGQAPSGPNAGQAAFFSTDAKSFVADHAMRDEVFGASSILVRCPDVDAMREILESLEGQLTITLQMDEADLPYAQKLLPVLERKAGRLLVNGFPTGVEVCHAMVHGGPFPSTADGRSTSVGSYAIYRFLRPVCYQDFPAALLAGGAARRQPGRIPRRIDGLQAYARRILNSVRTGAVRGHGTRITLIPNKTRNRHMPAPGDDKKARQIARPKKPQTAAELLVRCLENEGVKYIFGIPGEENIDVMDALLSCADQVRHLPPRAGRGLHGRRLRAAHRRAGRLHVDAGSRAPRTSSPGVADANMDRAPIVAIAGQGATTRLHKESHQILDLVNLFRPITKYSAQVLDPGITPEIVRKAFKVAQTEKPGGAFIDFPENIAEMPCDKKPIPVQTAYTPVAARRPRSSTPPSSSTQAKNPIILAGNGVIRQDAADCAGELRRKCCSIPVANTFMAKGVMPFTNELCIGTIGLKARDLPWFAFEKADVVICVGYDMVEYHPDMWNPDNDKTIIHIDALPAEVDANYIVKVGVLGDIGSRCARSR